MKIYTKTGDRGETGLVGGSRVRKTDPRIVAIGAVDELNALIGVANAEAKGSTLSSDLQQVQAELFELGAELASPPSGRVSHGKLDQTAVSRLEASIDRMTAELPPLRNFILPGGARLASALHHARAVCRRAELGVLSLSEGSRVRDVILAYLNRLSDWLFVAARSANRAAGVEDIKWTSGEG